MTNTTQARYGLEQVTDATDSPALFTVEDADTASTNGNTTTTNNVTAETSEADNDPIAVLRKVASSDPDVRRDVSLETLRNIIDRLEVTSSRAHVDDIAEDLQLDADQVRQHLVDLGTWLGQSSGRAPVCTNAPCNGYDRDSCRAADDEYHFAEPDDIPALYQTDDGSHVQLTMFPQLAPPTSATTGTVTIDPNTWVVPGGLEQRAWPLIANIHHHLRGGGDDGQVAATLRRYLQRRSLRPFAVTSFSLVCTVHTFAALRRLDDLPEVATRVEPPNEQLARALVAAHDLLDVSLARANESLRTLCRNQQLEAAAVKRHALVARMLAEKELRKLEKVADIVSNNPDAQQLLDRELTFLARRVADNPDRYLLSDIGQLTDGQVRKIAMQSGLDPDAADRDRAAERDLVKELTEIGVDDNDFDVFRPLVAFALETDKVDVLRDAARKWADGALDWDAELAEAFATSPAEPATV